MSEFFILDIVYFLSRVSVKICLLIMSAIVGHLFIQYGNGFLE